MKITDMLTTAVGNTLRSKTRTTLTVLAIFIGAFTLTITSAIGTGVSDYIDNQIGAFGAKDVLTITKASEETAQQEGPAEYDPDAGIVGADLTQFETEPLTEVDLDAIRRVDGILDVSAVRQVNPRYIEYDHAREVHARRECHGESHHSRPGGRRSARQRRRRSPDPARQLLRRRAGIRGCGQRGRRDSADRDRRLHRSVARGRRHGRGGAERDDPGLRGRTERGPDRPAARRPEHRAAVGHSRSSPSSPSRTSTPRQPKPRSTRSRPPSRTPGSRRPRCRTRSA